MIPCGEYDFKVIGTEIKVNKAEKEFIHLTLEIQDDPYKGQCLWVVIVPWYEFNWMHNVKSLFTNHEIREWGLEDSRNNLYAVASLAFERTTRGTVRPQEVNGKTYNAVFLKGKVLCEY